MLIRGREDFVALKVYKIVEDHTSWVVCTTAPAGVLGIIVATYYKVLTKSAKVI